MDPIPLELSVLCGFVPYCRICQMLSLYLIGWKEACK